MENGVRDQYLSARCAHCFCGVFACRPFQWPQPGSFMHKSIYMCKKTTTCIHACKYTDVYTYMYAEIIIVHIIYYTKQTCEKVFRICLCYPSLNFNPPLPLKTEGVLPNTVQELPGLLIFALCLFHLSPNVIILFIYNTIGFNCFSLLSILVSFLPILVGLILFFEYVKY